MFKTRQALIPYLLLVAAVAGGLIWHESENVPGLGRTVTTGLEELRVKESDRIAAMHAALALAGATTTETPDGLIIDGTGGRLLPGTGEVAIATHLDHRIAMAMAVAGLASEAGVTVDDTRPIATSFPVFEALLVATGAA